MTSQRSIDDIGLSHYSSGGGTTCSVQKRLVSCETCVLLTALRAEQEHSAFWEHEYHLAKDSRGERDALRRRVEALKAIAQTARQALVAYISVVRSVSRPDSFTSEVADAGGIARDTIKKLEAALRGEEEK